VLTKKLLPRNTLIISGLLDEELIDGDPRIDEPVVAIRGAKVKVEQTSNSRRSSSQEILLEPDLLDNW
jgi:hypothetical protein